ncbi:uncharacterized protein LOC134267321 isoform X2 [Saccostrea cucullata]|uniref:uncharacterized protein LOC134245868 n=2 Tax=Saccostrea cuccullata TaxID=36930 RepID=UPI002ED0398C
MLKMTDRDRVGGRFVKKGTMNRRLNMMKIREATVTQNVAQTEGHTCESNDESWRKGRRIVELDHMAKQMNCWDCGHTLTLNNIVNERRQGFASNLTITCECGVLNEVTTGKSHRVNKRGPAVFDINTKAALGMLHSGSGHTQVTNFMSSIEIEGMHHRTMKARECEVEPHIQSVAQQSCSEALLEEIQGNVSARSVNESNDGQQARSSGEFKYDMGWQKRGSGRAYNSKSGVGTLIGNKSGKICGFGVRSKDCRKCSFHTNMGKTPPEHKCCKNWEGSSKAMESNVAVELVNKIEKENVEVSVLVMDDDCTTMARINEEIPHPVIKWSDISHTKKHLGNSLYQLQKKHKNFNNNCVKYFQKCFSYAIVQNKNDTEALKKNLKQIVPHAFGEHDQCDSKWCTYKTNPEEFRHKSLPSGKDLQGDELKNDLNIIFETFINNAHKISPAASTRDVESFNNSIAAKAPKRLHYSSSSSLQNRVSCAVAEKNMGSTYVNKVNELVGVSPGRVFQKLAEKKDKTRKRRLAYENTREFKKRKLERKLKNSTMNSASQIREGVTYQSSVDLTQSDGEFVKEIPAPSIVPTVTPCILPKKYTFVYCDIETTSLNKTCDIIQIAAVSENGKFSKYILPSQRISTAASQVTGLTVHGNVLHLNGTPVTSVSLQLALASFLAWLDDQKPCIFVGHNFLRFDLPRVLRNFEICHFLHALEPVVLGVVDTLLLFREVYPGLEKYSQEFLVTYFLNENYAAHNAEDDVLVLQKLVQHVKPCTEVLVRHSSSMHTLVEKYLFDKIVDKNLNTLLVLCNDKILSKQMCKKIAESGLNLGHLKLAHTRGGLKTLLSEKFDGKPRVTSKKCLLEKVNKYFEDKQ